MLLHKTPLVLQWLFPAMLWKVKTAEKHIYLTFDDGPIPEVTPWVLDVLREHGALATFFCVGENVVKHPQIFQRLIQEGHSVGNHTHNHLNGWKTSTHQYLENVTNAQEALSNESSTTHLFRPPYGRLSRGQMKELKSKNIVMWDVLSGDFSSELNPDQVLEKSIKYTKPGSIIVFHDNVKAQTNLKYVLPAYLSYFNAKGFSFLSL